MGGNALKQTITQRLNRSAFLSVTTYVLEQLTTYLTPTYINIIPSYRKKQDFGDLDILIDAESIARFGGNSCIQQLIKKIFFSTEHYQNSNVLSFDFRWSSTQTEPGFQVDIIAIPACSYEFALHYFSYNDLGNLIGRTAHKQGCRFGHDGLWYLFRDGDHLFRKILISRDINQTLSFLGYDPKKFHQGFDSLIEIFKYVAESNFFNKDIFLLENRNYQSRVRDAKRKTYTDFLVWCKDQVTLNAYEYPKDKIIWLTRLFNYFPKFQLAYQCAVHDLAKQKTIKNKFNGSLVQKLTDKSGKPLGELIQKIKNSFECNEKFQDFILNESSETINQLIININKY